MTDELTTGTRPGHEDRTDCWCEPTVGWPGHPLGLVHRDAARADTAALAFGVESCPVAGCERQLNHVGEHGPLTDLPALTPEEEADLRSHGMDEWEGDPAEIAGRLWATLDAARADAAALREALEDIRDYYLDDNLRPGTAAIKMGERAGRALAALEAHRCA